MNLAEQRAYWLDTMLKIGTPVLTALADRELAKRLPSDWNPGRSRFAPLEAFARLACGMAPWLELEGLAGEEERLRERYAGMMLGAVEAAVDPDSPDRMDFATEGQPLVDAAFLAHALLRAPRRLAGALNAGVKMNLIAALKMTRRTVPGTSNWLCFSAMVEATLGLLGDPDYDRLRVAYAIRSFEAWYKGDGAYGDGPDFHWDYYNSFVIHPMLVDLVRQSDDYAELRPAILRRARRYAGILERMISPEGAYPIVGRSVTYRFGAFQLLSQAALQHFLPSELQPAQVRCALTAVIRRVMQAPGNFDEDGWLRPGVYGWQPGLAEPYINTGSLYLCAAVFLPLGLPPEDPFWSAPDAPWTAKIIASGGDLAADHALQE
ncbi:DUF2264 domain-containing protein [Cohnella sp. REN36]|uniref:DUF2264 domain-containing protein n=1 Tax=Cohnella sp. REN36 TaxID=2887347 RepID=UPI001D14FC85|nr:DUF2264 domain-containing protein [Cohnella sp. REN36]MCC3375329.1 DUF2264 domain-containing protein [Cohnella sp. REN36]